MNGITHVCARQILDSRGHPTLEAEVRLESGHAGRAAVPSGASTGVHEAHERRDGDPARYGGRGVLDAISAVDTEICEAVCGRDGGDQQGLDAALIALDGRPDKSRLGANAILGVSLAAARAAAAADDVPLYRHIGGDAALLPLPLMNVVNGGAHADNRLDVQEFMIAPVGAENLSGAVRMGAEIFHALRSRLRAAGHGTAVGDEGGFAPDIGATREALDLIMAAISDAGYAPGSDCALALDVAASEFFDGDKYVLKGEDAAMSSQALASYIAALQDSYPLVSIEDAMAEDDWQGWATLTAMIGDTCQLVGDDLFVTNADRVRRGRDEACANAVLIKPNQVGTLSETVATVRAAAEAGFAAIISHRSGETEDAIIADLSVALGVGQIKTGSLCRSERTAKYNRLMRIEAELGERARYAAGGSLSGFGERD